MANSVYKINKGINSSIEFKGLKAQYIWFLGAAVLGLLILFAILYICGLNQYLCLLIIGVSGTAAVYRIYGLSHKYGEHGLMKKMARSQVPEMVKNNSRKVFMNKKAFTRQ